MNRTIKEAMVNRYHYDGHEQLRTHLADFVTAYNYARRLKILKGPLALRIHLQRLDKRARPIHPRSDPPNAGTKHLVIWN
jgi:Integrase core domain